MTEQRASDICYIMDMGLLGYNECSRRHRKTRAEEEEDDDAGDEDELSDEEEGDGNPHDQFYTMGYSARDCFY